MLRESTSLSGMKYFGSGAIVGAALTLAVPRGVTSRLDSPGAILRARSLRHRGGLLCDPKFVCSRVRVRVARMRAFFASLSHPAATYDVSVAESTPTDVLFN